MYFSSKDIAHQALVAALSISIGVDEGRGKTDRLMYIPMATTTVRTTLPSKTVQFGGDNSADERNANIPLRPIWSSPLHPLTWIQSIYLCY